MEEKKIEAIKDLLAKHLETALDKEKVSDSVLRSAATFLRLYDPQNKPHKGSSLPTRADEQKTVQEAADELGGVGTPPFESINQEIES